ncbi:FG-GAP-like repeat-containing protein [Microbulbifer sp. JTAC008]|uniref:FG-GAP-like repeat-containing protein n=1 Tax=unclassified Microbulbifer TaxID=2619833 RepID=UPI00403987B5
MLKVKSMLGRLLGFLKPIKLTLFLTFAAFSGVANADEAEWTSIGHEILTGDYDGDGNDDLYLSPNPNYILLHGDVITPIVTDSLYEAIVLLSKGDGTYSVVASPNQSTLDSVSWSSARQSLLTGDFDGDGNTDYFLQGASASDDSLILLSGSSLVISDYLDSNLFASNRASVSVSDVDGDGVDDLLLEGSNGVHEVAYGDSNGELSAVKTYLDNSSSFVALSKGDAGVGPTGAASYNMPLEIPAGINGIEPKLSLGYSSQSGNGLLGMGWQLNGLSYIHRCKPTLATEGTSAQSGAERYSTSERLCLDGKKLIAISASSDPATNSQYWASGTEYRTEIDVFTKIVSSGSQSNGPKYFKAWTRSGLILEFGNTSDSRVEAPGQSSGPIGTWAVNKVTDRFGNSYTVTYYENNSSGEFYPQRVDYGPDSAVRFEYEDRETDSASYLTDRPWGYDDGGSIVTSKLLKSVTTYIDVTNPSNSTSGTPVRVYNLHYERGGITHRYRLAGITECGYRDDGVTQDCARPATFAWQDGEMGFESSDFSHCENDPADYLRSVSPLIMDVDNDGIKDIVFKGDSWFVARGTEEGCFTSTAVTTADGVIIEGTDDGDIVQPIRLGSEYGMLLGDRSVAPTGQAYLALYVVRFDLDGSGNSTITKVFPKDDDCCANMVSPQATVIVADFNSDGRDDFFLSRIGFGGSVWLRNDAEWDDGGDNFVDKGDGSMYGSSDRFSTRSPLLVDVDNDGLLDLSVHSSSGRYILRNKGDGALEYDSTPILPRGDGEDVDIVQVSELSGTNRSIFRTNKWHIKTTKHKHYDTNYNGIFTDINGDGLQDFLVRITDDGATNGSWRIYLNEGGTFGDEIDTGISTGDHQNQVSFPMDYNRDGLMDIVAQKADGSAWRVLLSTQVTDSQGQATPAFVELDVDPFGGILEHLLDYDISEDNPPVIFDINSDGQADVYYSRAAPPEVGGAGDPVQLLMGAESRTDLLKSATNSLGAGVEFSYSPLISSRSVNGDNVYTSVQGSDFPVINDVSGHYVVYQTETSDGLGGDRNRYYHYEGFKRDLHGRGFLGFEEQIVEDAVSSLVTTSEYLQEFPYTGFLSSKTIKNSSGKLVEIIDNNYELHSSNDRFPYLADSITREYGLTTSSTSSPLKVSKIESSFDVYGNPLTVTLTSGAGLSGSTVTGVEGTKKTVSSVSPNESDWLISFVDSRTVTTNNGSSSDQRSYTHTYTAEPDTLAVAVSKEFVGEDNWLQTTYTRNSQGLVTNTKITGGDIDGGNLSSRSIETLSDFLDQLYPQTVKNALDHTVTLTYDTRYGLVNSTTDANGLTQTTLYDAFGRAEVEQSADGTYTEIFRYFCDSVEVSCPADAVYVVISEITNDALPGYLGAPTSAVYYDMLGREVRSEQLTMSGGSIKVDTEYNTAGQVYRESEPFTGSSATAWTTYTYDELLRMETKQRDAGGSLVISYSSDSTYAQKIKRTVTVEDGDGGSSQQEHYTYLNSLGQVVRVVDANGTPISYEYDSQGNLVQTEVNGDSNSRISIDYDLSGNKVQIQDPDSGQLNFEYDGLGQLRRQTWAQGTANEKYFTQEFDLLGRVTSRIDTAADNTSETSSWVYDTTKYGLLSSKSKADFSESYHYDSLTRVDQISTSITGLGTKSFSYSYDAFSREQSVTYPGGFAVEHSYDSKGFPLYAYDITDLSAPALLWQADDTEDERGNLIYQQYGNGLVSKSIYDSDSGLLTGIITGDGNLGGAVTGNIQSLSYQYDSMGNLLNRASSREDSAGSAQEAIVESFTFDDLNRLTKASTTGLSSGSRVINYGYDDLGNLTSRTDVGTLKYERSGNAGVHAVTEAGGLSYQYDVYGNMTSRADVAAEYDVFNKPTRIDSTYFSYGPDRARYKQVNDSVTTYYLAGGQYEVVVGENGTTQKSYLGSYLLHSEADSGDTQILYMHLDHLGSVESITDDDGNLVERLAYSPFGLRRMDDWSDGDPTNGDPETLPTTKGYTGHEMLDQLSLVHMNGRVYDPVIGRFMSTDLFIQSPYNSQSFNRYTYTFNNPLSFVDPSGYYVVGNSEQSTHRFNDPGVLDDGEIIVVGHPPKNGSFWIDNLGAYEAAMRNLQKIQDYGVQQGGLLGAFTYVGSTTIFEVFIADALHSVDEAAAGNLGGALSKAAQTVVKPLKAVNMVSKLEKQEEKLEDSLTQAAKVNVKEYSDGSLRTPDGKFASRSGSPSPGTKKSTEFADFLRKNGMDVVGEELTVRGPVGKRRLDIVTRDAKGNLHGIEVKSGGATKTGYQRFTDQYINLFGARGTGAISGQTVKSVNTVYIP